MNLDLKELKVEKLTSKNWSNWKFKMELIFKEQKLIHIVQGKEIESQYEGDEEKSIFRDRSDKAFRILALSVSDQFLGIIKKAKCPSEAWKFLCENFERNCLANQMVLWKKLINLKYDGKDEMQVHINNLIELKNRLEAVGSSINNIILVHILLASLPKEYENLIIALETQKVNVDFEFTCCRIIEEYERRKSTDENSNNIALNVEKSKKKFIGKCNFCDKIGHKAKDCFKRKAHIEREKKKNNESKVNLVGANIEANAEALLAYKHENSTMSWLIDSGASNHMCNNRDYFQNFKASSDKEITIADGNKMKIIGEGDIIIKDEHTERTFKLVNVLFVPELKQNLLSVAMITSKGFSVLFTRDNVKICKSDKLHLIAHNDNGMFRITPKVMMAECYTTNKTDDHIIWHKRLGHVGQSGMKELIKQGHLNMKINDNINCESCILGKQTRNTFSLSETKSNEILELIHSDVCGPLPVPSIGGNKYFITFLDDYSHYVFVYFMKQRHEVKLIIPKFVKYLSNQKNKNIKIFRSDGAQENLSKEICEFFEENGIKHERSCPYTPEQNGKAERLNRTLMEISRSMLIEAKLHETFWAESIHTAVHLLNMRPSRSIDNKIPFTIWNGKDADFSYLRVFGCICYVHIDKSQRNKFDPKSEKHIFVGYSDNHKGYRVYNLETNRIHVAINVTFNEQVFIQNEQVNAALVVDEIPNSYSEAMKSPHKEKWKQAIDDELNSLIEKRTWKLIEKDKKMKLIDSKWIFNIKYSGNGEIERFKARLVAKGYTQLENVDYHETFSPVSKLTSIRTVLKIAMMEKMMIKQLDVKTAFLNGTIEEDIYMVQPEGYHDGTDRICKLRRSIYGLKQVMFGIEKLMIS